MVSNCMLGWGNFPCDYDRDTETDVRKSSAKSCQSGEQYPFTTGLV